MIKSIFRPDIYKSRLPTAVGTKTGFSSGSFNITFGATGTNTQVALCIFPDNFAALVPSGFINSTVNNVTCLGALATPLPLTALYYPSVDGSFNATTGAQSLGVGIPGPLAPNGNATPNGNAANL